MKKAVSVLGCVLFGLLAIVPVGTLLSYCFGYVFEFVSATAFAVITALLSVCLTVLSIIEKQVCESAVCRVFFALLVPLSLVLMVFYMLFHMVENVGVFVLVCALLCAGCCLFLTIKHGKPLVLKVLALSLAALMVQPIGFLWFLDLTFGKLVSLTVVKTVESPNGVYYAEVIDSDQGALGGDTLVDVHDNQGIHALLFTISKKPQRVYQGDWGAYKHMEMYWKNDHCLVINSVEYEVYLGK